MLRIFAPRSAVEHRPSLSQQVTQSTLLLMVATGAMILMLALLILFHQNANATKGYKLRTLERERSRLLLDEEVLKMQIAQTQALEKLESDKVIRAMVPVRSPRYTQEDTTVARQNTL